MHNSFVPVRLLQFAGVLALGTLLLSVTACDKASWTLRMNIRSHQQFKPESIRHIFVEQAGISIIPATTTGGTSPLESLVANEADLALVENNAAFVRGVRAVLPLYESVLHMLVRPGFTPEDSRQPLRNASFFITDQSVAGNAFVELITGRQGLTAADYRKLITRGPETADIVVYFGPIDAADLLWYWPGYELVSPGTRFNPQGKFFQESVGYIAPRMKPKVIPAFTYDIPGNDEPIFTVAVETLLVARKDLPEAAIFEFTRTLLEQKPRFTAISPQLFGGIHSSFDPLDLSFPLHDGARRYLDRNEPSLVERYAETVNMVVYLAVLLLTGLAGLARWRVRLKKDRIDSFYERVLGVRERMGGEERATLLEELANIENEAFLALINERLAANESFRIFTDLLSEVRAEILSKA